MTLPQSLSLIRVDCVDVLRFVRDKPGCNVEDVVRAVLSPGYPSSRQTIMRRVSEMADAGFISKVKGSRDSRRYSLNITSTGTTALEGVDRFVQFMEAVE